MACAVSDLNVILRALIAPAGLPADFDAADAHHACAAILDGGVDDFQLGALIAGLARHAREPAVLLGLRDAVAQRSQRLDVGGGDGERHGAVQPVVLPNYACTHGGQLAATALPLIVLLLQRFGVPVLVHGSFETSGGLAVTALLRDFGVLPCATRAQAQKTLHGGGVALVPLTLVSPGLAALMTLKARIGIETPGHVLAPLMMPVRGRALQVCQARPTEEDLVEMCVDAESDVLIVLGEEPAQLGSAAQRPRMMLRREGHDELLFDAEATQRPQAFNGTRAIAEWTRAALEGKVALPAPVINQLACCLYGAGYAPDFNQAKAIAAIETGGLAAA